MTLIIKLLLLTWKSKIGALKKIYWNFHRVIISFSLAVFFFFQIKLTASLCVLDSSFIMDINIKVDISLWIYSEHFYNVWGKKSRN
jgi:hypothetical protein